MRGELMPVLNDIQSRLNETEVSGVESPESVEAISATISKAALSGVPLCPAGALHSMGGQQFVKNGLSLSSRKFKRIGPFEKKPQIVSVQSGVSWPELTKWLRNEQKGQINELTIIQKQTGADELTLGGALSSNIHGRVLGRKPIVNDVQGFYITTPDSERIYCSRKENQELFNLVIGGYGLFGFIDSIDLSLTERIKLRRNVSENELDGVIPALEEHTADGAMFGDFQYMTDETSSDFLSKGVLSVYKPVAQDTVIPDNQLGLPLEDWKKLFVLAHTDKRQAYKSYLGHYLQTDGQIYWSDDHQFSPYLPEAGDMLIQQLGWKTYASLMITELYVPRDRFPEFMKKAREGLLNTGANVIYGTVRLIESEDETFLNWARGDFACIIFNLLVEHTVEGGGNAKNQFQMLIDCALEQGGSFYLTYHRWARKDQIQNAYPQFTEFLEKKNQYDPRNLFTSEWHRHYREMFS